jgi:hypothetical protein
MKESYERKVQDLQKVKLQNAQLLSIAGTSLTHIVKKNIFNGRIFLLKIPVPLKT